MESRARSGRKGERDPTSRPPPHLHGAHGFPSASSRIAAQLKEWGLDARTEQFEALMPYPTVRTLEMVAPVRYRALLQEPAIAADPDTAGAGQLPPFNAYAASGDVTAPLVYVNYGMP